MRDFGKRHVSIAIFKEYVPFQILCTQIESFTKLIFVISRRIKTENIFTYLNNNNNNRIIFIMCVCLCVYELYNARLSETQLFANKCICINIKSAKNSGSSEKKSDIYLLYLRTFYIRQSLINSRITVPCIISRHFAPHMLLHINARCNDRCASTLLNRVLKIILSPRSSCLIHIRIRSKGGFCQTRSIFRLFEFMNWNRVLKIIGNREWFPFKKMQILKFCINFFFNTALLRYSCDLSEIYYLIQQRRSP